MQFDQKRRAFPALLGGAAAWPLAARAQQGPRVWRIGCLFAGGALDVPGDANLGAFRMKMRELGYVEGQKLILDVQRAEGDFSRLPILAADLARGRGD